MLKTRSLDPLEPYQGYDHYSNQYDPATDFTKDASKDHVEKLAKEKLDETKKESPSK